MHRQTLFQRYTDEALRHAVYEGLADGSFVGRVPGLEGAIAFADTRLLAEDELRSVVEDWSRMGVQRGLALPVMGDVDLNTAEARDLVRS